MSTVSVGDVVMEYKEEGSGEPVLFVHGGVSDIRSWEAQFSTFARNYRALAYSRRYHWPNRPIPEGVPDPMSAHVDDLVGVIEALDARPAHVVGHSWGAFACLLAALRRPALMRSMVLVEPPVLPLLVSSPPRPAEIAKLLVTDPRTAVAFMRFGAAAVKPSVDAFKRGDRQGGARAFARGVAGVDDYDSLSEARREQILINAAPLEAELLRGGLEPLKRNDLTMVRVPTLLVNGTNSPPFFSRLNGLLEKLLPNASRVTVANASHWAHEDNPEEFNKLVLDFIYSHATRGA